MKGAAETVCVHAKNLRVGDDLVLRVKAPKTNDVYLEEYLRVLRVYEYPRENAVVVECGGSGQETRSFSYFPTATVSIRRFGKAGAS